MGFAPASANYLSWQRRAQTLGSAQDTMPQPQHILVVDDEAPIRDLLTRFFQKRGYQVTTAASVEEATRMAAAAKFNLIILDILLSDGDGLDLLGNFKLSHPDVPVIIMTGIGFDEELFREAQDKGAAGFVAKTLPLDQLLMEVHRSLGQFKP